MKDIIEIKGSKQIFNMKKIEYARWLCLIEAIDLIERKAQELKTDMIGDDFWVKPLAFQKYIDQRLETMIIDVDREEFNIPTALSIETNKHIIKSTADEISNDSEIEEDVEPSAEELAIFNN